MAGLAQLNNNRYMGYYNANQIMEDIINTGITETSDIIRTSITTEFEDTAFTLFRTATAHFAVQPSVLTVSGFTGACATLNGEHLFDENTNDVIRYRDPDFMDFGPVPENRTEHYFVAIKFNSSALPVSSGSLLNISACPGSDPKLSVSYGPINQVSNVRETVVAYNYWMSKAIDGSIHTLLFWPTFCNNDTFIYEWDDLKTQQNLCSNSVWRNVYQFRR